MNTTLTQFSRKEIEAPSNYCILHATPSTTKPSMEVRESEKPSWQKEDSFRVLQHLKSTLNKARSSKLPCLTTAHLYTRLLPC